MPLSVLENISIVLVHPQLPANIGAACRAMKNMGLSDLRLVHPPLDRKEQAQKLAHGAGDILESARRVFTLEEALDDIQYVVGTTARLGGWRHQIKAPRSASGEILSVARENRVAILFGAEDYGLPNDIIKHCQMLISIPTSKKQNSLNLAQAVLLIGYELRLGEFPGEASSLKLANSKNVEDMFSELSQALELINFMRPGNPDYWMQAFKRLFARSGLTEREVNMFRGICRQVRWMNGRREEAEATVKITDTDQ